MMLNRGMTALDDNALRKFAPSIFARGAIAGVSDRYSFLPTCEVVTRMRNEGWLPVMASEQRVKTAERHGFQKHLIRFRMARDLVRSPDVNAHFIETVLTNSHDRSCAYQLHAGVFRLVCSNGMVVADATFGHMSMKHVGFDPAKVLEGSFKIIRDIPNIDGEINAMKARRLSPDEALHLATSAVKLRYGNDMSLAPYRPDRLLHSLRRGDDAMDLWTKFNLVQEHMIKGGVRDLRQRRTNGRPFSRTRAVQGIDESLRLNKALWNLAQSFVPRSDVDEQIRRLTAELAAKL